MKQHTCRACGREMLALNTDPVLCPDCLELMRNGTLARESCFETFINAGDLCVVLARSGKTALIMRMLCNKTASFVVPLEHVPGELSWWQGHYFNDLSSAWAYYQNQINKEDPEK